MRSRYKRAGVSVVVSGTLIAGLVIGNVVGPVGVVHAARLSAQQTRLLSGTATQALKSLQASSILAGETAGRGR